jgi:putative addiction module component (TIGR02574 family)
MRSVNIPEIERLSTPEKILLLEDLWDSSAADEASIPVPQSHKEELDRRLARHAASPGDVLSLDELRSRIERTR